MYRFYSTIYLCKSINIAINDNLFANEFSSMTTCIIPRGQIPIFKQPFDWWFLMRKYLSWPLEHFHHFFIRRTLNVPHSCVGVNIEKGWTACDGVWLWVAAGPSPVGSVVAIRPHVWIGNQHVFPTKLYCPPMSQPNEAGFISSLIPLYIAIIFWGKGWRVTPDTRNWVSTFLLFIVWVYDRLCGYNKHFQIQIP